MSLVEPSEDTARLRLRRVLQHAPLFADLDPEAAFRELHERFLPVPYEPGYFVSLKP